MTSRATQSRQAELNPEFRVAGLGFKGTTQSVTRH